MSSTMSSTMSPPHFLLFDLETTGLNPETCGILEVSALLIHPEKLLEIEKFHSYVNPENTAWDTEALQMHRKTGLIDRLSEGKLYDDVEKSILYLLRNCGTVILMGNSVHFDRSFIARYMPILNSRLYYRHLDVTSVRMFIQLYTGKDPMDWVKERNHKTEDDIYETLQEANIYASRLGLHLPEKGYIFQRNRFKR